jgi:hypothetical protein
MRPVENIEHPTPKAEKESLGRSMFDLWPRGLMKSRTFCALENRP